MIRLGDLFDFKNGRSFKKTEWKQTGLPIIRIQNLNNEDAPFNYFDDEYDSSIEVNPDDLLFSWSGTVGSSFGPHIWNREKAVLNQHIFKLTFKKEMEKRYAFYSLLFITAEIERSVVGAVGLVHVTKKSLNEFQIPLPPIPEQQRIVAILDQAFADIEQARANAKKNLKNARELFDSYLNQVFSQRGEGWVEYSLKDIVTLKSGTTVKKELENTAGDIAYIKVSGMSLEGNEKEITTAKTFLNGTEINSSNVLPVGTTIFPKRGGAIATNKKRITAIPLCVDLNTMGVIPKKAFILPLYLYFFFKTFDLLSISNGTTIPQINNYSFDDLKLSVPDIETQETLIKRLTQIETSTDDLSFKYEQKLESLDELKRSLLQKAFSGELTKSKGIAA
jgi:type I restriction enzyme S subunit